MLKIVRSEIMKKIDLVGKGKKKIEWKNIHQQAFDDIKKVMAKERQS